MPPPEPQSLVKLGRSSLTYALGGLAYKGVALLSAPILARLLTPAELGLLDLAAVIASVVGLAAAIGSEQAIAYLEPRVADLGRLWGSALAAVAITTIAAVGTIVIASRPMADVVIGDGAEAPLMTVAGVYGAVVALTTLALNAVRLHGTPRVYAATSFVIVTAEMAAALAIAVLVSSPVVLMVFAWAMAATLVAVPVLLRFAPRPTAPDPATMRRLAVYGLPLVPAAIAWLVGDAAIRGAVARLAEPATLGEYGIASRLAGVLALAVSGFGVAWYPYIYRSPASSIVEKASHALPRVLFVLLAGAGGMTLLAPEIILIAAGEPYLGARAAVPAMALGAVASGVVVLVGAVVGASGSTRRVAAAAVLGAAVQVVLAPVAVEAGGLDGAALTSLLGATLAGAVLLVTERRLWLRPEGFAGLAVLALGAAVFALGTAVMGLPLATRVLAAALLAAAALGVLRQARLPRIA
mgnify:CR=1 FL=1